MKKTVKRESLILKRSVCVCFYWLALSVVGIIRMTIMMMMNLTVRNLR